MKRLAAILLTAVSAASSSAAQPPRQANPPQSSAQTMVAPNDDCAPGKVSLPESASISTNNFNLAGGVIWKKFHKMKDKFVLGQPAEGRAIAIFKTCLNSKNQELATEARTILDAIAATRDILGERLEAARAAGRPDAEEWIRLYLRSFPSRRSRFKPKPPNRRTTNPPPAKEMGK